MSLVKRNEDYPMWPSIFNDFFGRNFLDFTSRNFSATNTTLPSVNIMEDQDQFIVELAAPGFEKEDFKIEHNNNVLTISSDKRVENETKEGECYSQGSSAINHSVDRLLYPTPLKVKRSTLSTKMVF